jgi:hypothetical protein
MLFFKNKRVFMGEYLVSVTVLGGNLQTESSLEGAKLTPFY